MKRDEWLKLSIKRPWWWAWLHPIQARQVRRWLREVEKELQAHRAFIEHEVWLDMMTACPPVLIPEEDRE